MKIALAQLNATIGDIKNNGAKIEAYANRAKIAGADLVVFPELAITGYPPHDLLERRRFVEDSQKELTRLSLAIRGIGVIVGTIQKNPDSKGKPLINSGALLFDGQVVSVHGKTLLPTYDVFDERRYFAPSTQSTCVPFKNKQLGITVCEDIWKIPSGNLYSADPVKGLITQGADIIVNLSASPFTLEKRTFRPTMLKEAALLYKKPIIFVNQVGGNDDLVFDGGSMAVDATGNILARGHEFEEDLVLVDLANSTGEIHPPLEEVPENAAMEALVLGTKDYARKCGFSSAVLGLSGGVDSALVAFIAARALGPQNVYCLSMPTRYSSDGSKNDALQLAKNLGVHYQTLSIDDLFQSFLDKLDPFFNGKSPDVTEENIQARIRGVSLMALSNKFGHLLLTTGNKSEMAMGYCTLYGDMAGGLAVLSDVPKTLVFDICRYLNKDKEVIPHAIIEKPPSAELREDQKDEDSLPPYPVLDGILHLYIDKGCGIDEIVSAGFDETTVKDIVRLVTLNEYKRRQAPPGLKITSKAFGIGRRLPMAQRWIG